MTPLHVDVAGEGPSVLLLHGIPANGALWRDVVPGLARHARVLVPDLLGFGRSGPPNGRPTDIPAQAGYLVEMLDRLGIGRVSVVGHDIGGGVAQHLAVHHPERVERLGLVNSVCYDNWPVPELRALQIGAPVVRFFPAGLVLGTVEWDLQRGFAHRDRAKPFLDAFLEPFTTASGLDALVELAQGLDARCTQTLAPELPRLHLPAAVVWGEQDPFLALASGERLARNIPDAQLTRIPDASHFAPADAPGAVTDALLQLLARPVP